MKPQFFPRFGLLAAAVAAALIGFSGSSEALVYTESQEVSTSQFNESVSVNHGSTVTFTAENVFGKSFTARNYKDIIDTFNPSAVFLGTSKTNKIEISNHVSNAGKVISGLAVQGPQDNKYSGSTMNVQAHDLVIDLSSDYYSYGIYAMNASTNKRDDDGNVVNPAYSPVKLSINAENTYINVSTDVLVDPNDHDHRAIGIVALSEGEIEINGNLYVTAPTAIATRGKAVININKENDENTIVQLNGDINFNYNSQTSGTPVQAFVTINLNNASSYLKGDIVVNGTNIPEGYDEVDDMRLNLSNGGSWIIPTDNDESVPYEKAAQVNLTLSDGVLQVEDPEKVVHLKSFAGTGGRIFVGAQKQADGTYSHSTVQIADWNTNAAAFTVQYLGVTADDVSDAAKTMEEMKNVIQSSDTSSTYTQTNIIAEGDVRGELSQVVSSDGSSQAIQQKDNTKLESFKGVNAASLVQWRNQVNHLTKRLGDVRLQQGDAGAWARVYGGEYKWGDANHVDMTSTTVQAGGDARVGDWIVGGAFSYSDSSFDLENGDGDGDGDLYTIALYGSRMFEKGSYIDFVARYGYIKNDFKAGNMGVSLDSNAFGLSVETGHTFKLMERAYFEPQIEVSYGYAQGDDAIASNGVLLEQDDYQNLITRIGLRTGFDFPENAGTIYAHVSYSYDFLGDADGTASKDGMRTSLSEDLGGGWVTYGIGGQFRLGQSTFAYGELERSTGGDVENPWAFNVGVRHLF